MIEVGTNGTIAPPIDGVIRGAKRAETKGYDSMWWPDHLMGFHDTEMWKRELPTLAQSIPSAHVFLDAVAAIAVAALSTERIKLGTAVTDVIRRHPAMLAQEFLTLDHISSGRVILGVGAGEGENTLPYGLPFDRPAARLEEALRIIRLLWSSPDPIDYDGEFWILKRALCGLSAYSGTLPGGRIGPPIWCGAHGPRMLRMTGELCDGWLPTYQGGPVPWDLGLGAIRVSAAKAGRDLTGFTPGLLAHVVVAENRSVVDRLLEAPLIRAWMLSQPASSFEAFGVEHPLGKSSYGLLNYIPTWKTSAEIVKAAAAVPVEVASKFLLSGTPDEILRELQQFVERGLQHLVLWNLTYLGDASQLQTSFGVINEIVGELKK